jgi:4-aminobutyrate aminotransferase-like enzyme
MIRKSLTLSLQEKIELRRQSGKKVFSLSNPSLSSTFQGNIISINSSLIFIKYLEKIDYLSKIKKIEIIMAEEANNLKKFKFVREIRGIGFMWGIEVNNNYFSKKDFTNTIRSKLLKNRLITWESGFDSNVICLVPPITIPISSIKSAFKIINKTFNEIESKFIT